MVKEPKFFNPRAEVAMTKNRLPHWEQDAATYFLTFRMADSLPKYLLDAWKEERRIWIDLNPEPWSAFQEMEYHERFSGMRERWLDAMHGSCLLRDPSARRPLADKLRSTSATIWSYVIMPNHVHVLCSLSESQTLPKLIQKWKGGSAYEINRALRRSGKLWAKDYFDRLVRSETHFQNCARYIRRNPKKAKLSVGEFSLFESDCILHILGGGS